MSYQLITTGRLDKDLKLMRKRDKDMLKLKQVMAQLLNGESLPPKYRDHMLIRNYAYRRECHIEADWLLIYKIDKEKSAIIFERTGTHSDLF